MLSFDFSLGDMGERTKAAGIVLMSALVAQFLSLYPTNAIDPYSPHSAERGETVLLVQNEGTASPLDTVPSVPVIANPEGIAPEDETRTGGQMLNRRNSTISQDNDHVSRRLRRHFRIQRQIQERTQAEGRVPRTFNREGSLEETIEMREEEAQETTTPRTLLSQQRVLCRMKQRVFSRQDTTEVRERLIARYSAKVHMSPQMLESELRRTDLCVFPSQVVFEMMPAVEVEEDEMNEEVEMTDEQEDC